MPVPSRPAGSFATLLDSFVLLDCSLYRRLFSPLTAFLKVMAIIAIKAETISGRDGIGFEDKKKRKSTVSDKGSNSAKMAGWQ